MYHGLKSLMSRPISCHSYICTITTFRQHHQTADVLWERLCDFVRNKWQYHWFHVDTSYAKELAIKSNLEMLLEQFLMDFVNEQRILCKLELCGLTIEVFYMGQIDKSGVSKRIWEFHVVENNSDRFLTLMYDTHLLDRPNQ
jgi:hypothetical protein